MSHLQRFFDAARARAAALPAASPPMVGGVERRSLRAALGDRDEQSVIVEFKRRSPSQGLLSAAADPASYARRATRLGAVALSVLTEPSFFDGSYTDLAIARAVAEVPILAKDFIVDDRQIAAAARHGADAVLLILRGLDEPQLSHLLETARLHALDVVLECHDASEVERAVAVPDAIVGVNNRDLDSLEVDVAHALELLPAVPKDRCAIAESGYRSGAELQALRGIANGVLIGTSIMRGTDLSDLVAGGRT